MAADYKAGNGHHALTGVDRLGLRISTMLTSPQAQLDRRLVVHRLDTDDDESWQQVMELIEESEGVRLAFNEDGSVIVTWDRDLDGDYEIERGEELVRLEEDEVPF